MYTKILVPLDGSALAERAINHAAEIARGTGAEIILLNVIQAPLSRYPEAGPSEELKTILEEAAKARVYLGSIASRLVEEGLKARSEVIEGTPDAVILGYAHDHDVDILVMSTHGRTGLSKALMGSVAEKVMHTTKRPVVMVKPERLPSLPRADESDVFLSTH